MSINRSVQVAAAAAAVVVGALCTTGVANASDHHNHHHGSYASDRDRHGDDGENGREEDQSNDKKGDKSKLEIAGLDLGAVTDAVSDLLNSLGGIL